MNASKISSMKHMNGSVSGEGKWQHLVPLASLIGQELRHEKFDKPCIRYGHVAQPKKGEDYFLVKTECQWIPGNSSTSFSVFFWDI